MYIKYVQKKLKNQPKDGQVKVKIRLTCSSDRGSIQKQMKKVGILLMLVIYFVVISNFNFLYANENVVETDILVGKDIVATTSSTPRTINYELPFPGMLPDNPFYFLKVIRDGLIKMLINDDLKRARFSLESGEKRVYAARLLIGKNKDKLAIDTLSKGNNYLNDAIIAIKKYSKDNPTSTDVKPFLSEFDTAVLKIIEINTYLKPSVDKAYLNNFLMEKKRTEQIEKVVKQALLAK